MPYTLSRRANNTVEVTAELDSAAVETERSEIVRSFRMKASVPGFRPGKAPESAVRARFGEDIEQELKEHLAGKLLGEVFDGEAGLQPITHPEVSDATFDEAGGFRLKAEMELRPRFELPPFDCFQLPEARSRSRRRDRGRARVGRRGARGLEAGGRRGRCRRHAGRGRPARPDGGVGPGALRREGGSLRHRCHGTVPPPINEALQGVRAGEQRIAERRFPDDDADRRRAGKTVRYTIDVTALKRKVRPAIDDELARTLGFQALDGLRERVAEVLGSSKRRQRREQWRRALLDHLEVAIDVNELPPSLFSSAVREELNRIAYTMSMEEVAPHRHPRSRT